MYILSSYWDNEHRLEHYESLQEATRSAAEYEATLVCTFAEVLRLVSLDAKLVQKNCAYCNGVVINDKEPCGV
jgi:hypothetical protein